jgi:hypothetical protein
VLPTKTSKDARFAQTSFFAHLDELCLVHTRQKFLQVIEIESRGSSRHLVDINVTMIAPW